MPLAIQAGLWGLLSGSALLIGALVGWFARLPERLIAAIMAMIVDTMVPEAFEGTHDYPGLIAVTGFLVAFGLSKLG